MALADLGGTDRGWFPIARGGFRSVGRSRGKSRARSLRCASVTADVDRAGEARARDQPRICVLATSASIAVQAEDAKEKSVKCAIEVCRAQGICADVEFTRKMLCTDGFLADVLSRDRGETTITPDPVGDAYPKIWRLFRIFRKRWESIAPTRAHATTIGMGVANSFARCAPGSGSRMHDQRHRRAPETLSWEIVMAMATPRILRRRHARQHETPASVSRLSAP